MILALALALAMQGAMDDASATIKAKTIWGPTARVGTARGPSDTYWTKEVGCSDAAGNFNIAGAGLNTWEAAFATVDTTKNGPQADGSFLCTPTFIVITDNAPAGAAPTFAIGTAASIQFSATGGGVSPTYTWSVVQGALPAGLTLDPAAGTVTGTPTTAGAFSFVIQCQSGVFIGSTQMAGSINVPVPPPGGGSTTMAVGPFLHALGKPLNTFTLYHTETRADATYALQVDFALGTNPPQTQSFTIPAGTLTQNFTVTASVLPTDWPIPVTVTLTHH